VERHYGRQRFGLPENELRAFVFAVLVLMNIGLIVVNRSFRSSLKDALLRPNRTLWVLITAVLLVLGTGLYWKPAQALFHFGPLHLDDVAACLLAGTVLIGALEMGKRFVPVQRAAI
jgi:Ca2+-transporting ATPase